jgi:hypothetical protein
VELTNRCAYNKTRGYILGVEIACGDFNTASLADRLPMLTPKSGAGLWMIPFKGIPATDVPVPLDLIYLDKNCQVIETVEFFPTFRVSPSSPPAASVLALPVHSVFASHSQPGDLVAFGHIEDVEQELALLFGSGAAANAAQEALGARRGPVASAAAVPQREASVAPALPKELERPSEQALPSEPAKDAAEPEPEMKEIPKKKSWLQRLLSPEPPQPRKNLRASLPGLTAYFWTGATPLPHTIRDISYTGLYVVTEERWYPGTLIQMTLKKTGKDGAKSEVSIALHAKALRWGNDGVGLEFVVRDPRNPHNGADGASRVELDRFLEVIGHSKS